MIRYKNIAIVAAVVIAAATVVVIKQRQKEASQDQDMAGSPTTVADSASSSSGQNDVQEEALPKLLDLGAGKCIPCKAMEPILEELEDSHADTFSVQFIDVWKNKQAAEKYGVQTIPTQIFFDAEGNELFRHEGFFSKEDILKTWEKYGVEVDQTETEKKD